MVLVLAALPGLVLTQQSFKFFTEDFVPTFFYVDVACGGVGGTCWFDYNVFS